MIYKNSINVIIYLTTKKKEVIDMVLQKDVTSNDVTAYQIYNADAKKRTQVNILDELFPELPQRKYSVIYADPPWDYGGKVQFDNSSKRKEEFDASKKVFISSASFQYPTVKLKDLKKLDVPSIAEDDCLLFMWTTGPQLANAIELGKAWGFEYKTVGFVWDKMIHNPGQYTLSQTEQVLIFKRGRIPKPRGARNMRQLVEAKRGKHSEKPEEVALRIEKMFPSQEKIELFSRKNRNGWTTWGLDMMEEESYTTQENLS